MSVARSVVVLGGGITGLATAFALERARRGGANVRYTVLERAPRVGGNLRTEQVEGCVVDAGPDGFVASKPHAAALCKELGLASRLVTTREENRRVYMAHHGRLVRMPEGMSLVAPTRPWPVIDSPLFSPAGKLRMALDLVLPPGPEELDESLGAFVRRRLGPEAADVLAEPLLAGIHAGDPDALSVRACFPQLVAMEHEHGGLILGGIASRNAAMARHGGRMPSAFLSLEGGLGTLPEALERALAPGSVRTDTGALALERTPDGRWRVHTTDAGSVEADQVVLALPARPAAQLLARHDDELASLLLEIPYLSTATVYFGFDRADVPHPLDGSGFLVPRRERSAITASTWISSKWPGRAPDDMALLRVFFGGARAPEATERDDDALVAAARPELSRYLGITATPRFTRVYRFHRGNPQMHVGHLARMARVRERLGRLGGLHLAGGGYGGVGVPDCVKQGESAATALLAGVAGVAS